ncbi:hypothetical protein BDN70DRAFT_862297 [Pholiota conissans]|uniref:F-box domain-containing protein n=1 Tax=Pholiota conissans TaxID=109636 RepID=A0A9P5YWT5_9AGAR|nr:hypothetical protein BDN70DRAFT_862297 [Pholiota conissans]
MSSSRTHRSAKAAALRKISEVLNDDSERCDSDDGGLGSASTTTVSDSDSEEEYEGGCTCGAEPLFAPRKTSDDLDDNSESDSAREADDSEDGYNGMSEDEDEFYREPGRPPAKRAKLSAASTSRAPTDNSTTKKGRSRMSLSLLPTMPLDVLFEILGQLTPKDLINISRTNKLFHDTLYSRGARMVWKEALRGQGAPGCPHDLIEPRLAILLFGTTCEECGHPNVHKVDFDLRRRACVSCKQSKLLGRARVTKYFPNCDGDMLDLVPYTNVGGYAQGHSSNQCFWWSTEIQEVMQAFATAKDKKRRGIPGAQKELNAFKKKRLARVNEIDATAESLDAWFKRAALRQYKENKEARVDRLEAIKAKFIELGYSQKYLGCLARKKECTQKAALTDKIWNRIRPVLEPIVKQKKEEDMRELRRIRKWNDNWSYDCGGPGSMFTTSHYIR